MATIDLLSSCEKYCMCPYALCPQFFPQGAPPLGSLPHHLDATTTLTQRVPYLNVARYANGDEEWPEPFPWKPLEARAMITAIQGLAASKKRSKEVQEYLTYCRRTVVPIAESLRAWREELSASGLSVSTVNRKLSAVKRTIRTATAGADATVRGALEAILSAAVHTK